MLDREYEQYRDPGRGLFSYADYPATTLQGLTVFDNYANTDEVGQMASDQIDKLVAHGGLGQEFVLLLSWTLTGKLGKQDVEQIANTANGNLPVALYQSLAYKKPGIVYIDFIDLLLSQSIIQYNF